MKNKNLNFNTVFLDEEEEVQESNDNQESDNNDGSVIPSKGF